MNIGNFRLRLVRSLVDKRIKAVPWSSKELSHKLVCIYMNNKARYLCDYCDLFSKKKRSRQKCKAPEYNITLCSVGDHSGPGTGQDRFSLAHNKSEIMRADKKKSNYIHQY